MFNKIRKENKGFTIIEVLIVLAIAGLIMLIVFLAVPALQRNSRNSGRRSDVGRIGSEVTEFVSNNNGTLPVAADNDDIANLAGALAQYDFITTPANLIVYTAAPNPAVIANLNQMRIVVGKKCATLGTVTAVGATTRSIAIQYALEASGTNTTPVCQDV